MMALKPNGYETPSLVRKYYQYFYMATYLYSLKFIFYLLNIIFQLCAPKTETRPTKMSTIHTSPSQKNKKKSHIKHDSIHRLLIPITTKQIGLYNHYSDISFIWFSAETRVIFPWRSVFGGDFPLAPLIEKTLTHLGSNILCIFGPPTGQLANTHKTTKTIANHLANRRKFRRFRFRRDGQQRWDMQIIESN